MTEKTYDRIELDFDEMANWPEIQKLIEEGRGINIHDGILLKPEDIEDAIVAHLVGQIKGCHATLPDVEGERQYWDDVMVRSAEEHYGEGDEGCALDCRGCECPPGSCDPGDICRHCYYKSVAMGHRR